MTNSNDTQDPKNNPQYPVTNNRLPNPNDVVEGYKIEFNGVIYIKRNGDWIEHLNLNNSSSFSDSDFPNETPDVGILARDLMEKKAEVKRLKRRRLIDRSLFWVLILIALSFAGYGVYQLVLANYETGRYYDTRECKVSSANLTVTGKRTYSYPFKSLFGFRLVDENSVKEKTTLTLNGSPMTIVGTSKDRWWGIRLAQGDRNVQILRDADVYTFTTDKGIAVVTYKGFCQQREQSTEMDPKTKDFPIIN